ncbi:helicase-associated domain-containing protein [Cellulomonas marina]|uniref:Helicase conserved C-terminal domain-containing protein n=1 Tax=Cellulomonas marina TaxID=988821 RepID=A0A1I0WJ32_9CELL|nr:helicase-associated domain-containing protein [Cellulomonas marina]GIG27686.1 hypothetical protein Cma02nite_02860 [Cellulomonas marina]SFA88631.1 Helicase conserved C-terminal domain-containing protein [Cellulomonas marina]
MATFLDDLRARDDDALAALLRARPDLASPSPVTLASLAVRATGRTSTDRALAELDATTLQVLEAVVVLDGAGTPPIRARLHDALGADDDVARAAVDAAVGAALERALVLEGPGGEDAGGGAPGVDRVLRAAPGLADALGPYPAGLAPATVPDPPGTAPGDDDPAGAVAALLGQAPTGAAALLDALVWGPPVGVAPAPRTPAAAAVAALLRAGLLAPGTGSHVVLPRGVALALRGGRTHAAPALPPAPGAPAPGLTDAGVATESAAGAERAVRLVEALLRLWERTPPRVLRGGGLGVRDLRRTAAALDVAEDEVAVLVEVAGAAGLVADDGEELPAFLPTASSDTWAAGDLPQRWSALVRAWVGTVRAPWLVGTRDEHGSPRAALDPTVQRTWAPRLRREVLVALAALPPAVVAPPEGVLAALRHRAPRSVPPEPAVRAVLAEAALLGVLGAGALGAPGRALLAEVVRTGPVTSGDEDPVAAALAAALPEPVDVLLLQADLTGVVPGRPADELADLLEAVSVVESRGGALTVRFTAGSVREGLDAGRTADDVLAALARHVPGGRVPQPLEYLVRDVARQHGRLRAGTADGYLRSDDPAVLAGLVEDPRLASLGLFRLAPTVLGARATAGELLAALRAAGRAPVAEGPDGQVVHAGPATRRARGRGPRASVPPPPAPPARVEALVARLRAADEHERALEAAGATAGTGPQAGVPTGDGGPDRPGDAVARVVERAAGAVRGTSPRAGRDGKGDVSGGASGAAGAGGTADPASALLVLRQAAADRTAVRVELVGPDGRLQERVLRPLRVDAGRLRAVDPARAAELTIAVHRIAGVRPVDPPDAP